MLFLFARKLWFLFINKIKCVRKKFTSARKYLKPKKSPSFPYRRYFKYPRIDSFKYLSNSLLFQKYFRWNKKYSTLAIYVLIFLFHNDNTIVSIVYPEWHDIILTARLSRKINVCKKYIMIRNIQLHSWPRVPIYYLSKLNVIMTIMKIWQYCFNDLTVCDDEQSQ